MTTPNTDRLLGRLRLALVPAAAVFLVACASTPTSTPALDQARALYAQAAADPNAARSAPLELRSAPGQFTPSSFVQSVTGVDNVCERAAVLDAGGNLFYPKFACNGVTFALACRPFAPDWRWQNA